MLVRKLVFRLLCLALTICVVQGFNFYLQSGTTQCFTESWAGGTPIVGIYLVSAGAGDMPVDLLIRGADRSVYVDKKNIVYGKFAFVVPVGDEDTKVWDAEIHRKKHDSYKADGNVPHRRRLLSVKEEHYDDKHIENHQDLEDEHRNDWDYDDYEGIDEDELQDEVKRHKGKNTKRNDEYDDGNNRIIEICFSHGGHKQQGVKRRVSFRIDAGKTAKDYTRMAKRKHLTKLQRTLREASDELSELLVDLDAVREEEEALANLIESTYSILYRYAVFGLVAMLAVGSFQAYYTKTYLRKKKVM